MNKKFVGLLIATVIAMIALTSVASAVERYPIKFEGYVLDPDTGAPLNGALVEIIREDYLWRAVANSDGSYETLEQQWLKDGGKQGEYTLYINGEKIETRYIQDGEFNWIGPPGYTYPPYCWWSYQWDYDLYVIPEFSTIAIPIVTILGLLFLFNRRKRKLRA